MTLASTIASLLLVAPSARADALEDGHWWYTAMGVDELHRRGSGEGVTVAVIDGPIDPTVPELKGKVASSSTDCLARGGGKRPSTLQGVDADHATSMAALIVGTGQGTAARGRGIRGIAPNATLRHYATSYRDPKDSSILRCGTKDPAVDAVGQATAAAIRRAVAEGAKVISISLTTDYSSEYVDASGGLRGGRDRGGRDGQRGTEGLLAGDRERCRHGDPR